MRTSVTLLIDMCKEENLVKFALRNNFKLKFIWSDIYVNGASQEKSYISVFVNYHFNYIGSNQKVYAHYKQNEHPSYLQNQTHSTIQMTIRYSLVVFAREMTACLPGAGM